MWTEKLSELERLIAGKHFKQAVQEAGSVLEQALREVLRATEERLPPGDKKAVAEALQKIGQGKTTAQLTLGQLLGVFREAKVDDKSAKALGRKSKFLNPSQLQPLLETRNEATHEGAKVTARPAKLFVEQVGTLLEELGWLDAPAAEHAGPAAGLRPWSDVVKLHPDVTSSDFSEDMFALDLGPLADGLPNVPAVYRDAEHFFRTSHLTTGLRGLLDDVLSRLAGGSGNRVLKLMTPFGGGKSHTLAALWHAARDRSALDVLSEAAGLPRPAGVQVAAFDGAFFDATSGKVIPGEAIRARTMWGWIAGSLGGRAGYELVRAQDEGRVAPGGDVILELLADRPNLILLDETLQYLISAGAIRIEQSTLRDETLTFLQRLTTAVSNTKNSALVFSLQSSKRESLEYVNLLQTVDHLAARKDQRREPVEGNEILSVIQRRLLARLPGDADANPAAMAYQDVITQMRRAYAESASERAQAEEEGLALRDRVRKAYPFHPALIDLMRERWAAIPDFQRTRGALRFLAACLRRSREARDRAMVGPGDVPIHDSEVRLAFFKEVGQQADFQAVLEHDLVGANARARRIDERRAKEFPADAARRPATRLATAILMYSFGGLRRDGGAEAKTLPPGVTEPELLSACVGPDLDRTTAQACLKELKEQCLYLHYDGVRYCFKKDPNVTLLIEQEAEAVGRSDTQVRSRIKEMIEARLAGHRNAVIWPDEPSAIDDKDPQFLVAYLPLEFAAKPRSQQEAAAKTLLESSGSKQRSYRNGLGLAIPAGDQAEILRRAVRYLIAAEGVKAKARQLNLTDEQKSQLREREATEAAAAESALLKLYTEVWLPRAEEGGIGIEKISAGGRPLQTTLNDKKRAMIHERIVELITQMNKRVFDSIRADKIVELFRLGEETPQQLGISTSAVVDGFYSFLGFTRLMSSGVIRKAIAKGVQDGHFGYVSGPKPTTGPDGKFQVALAKVRFKTVVADDEIDLDSGFLILPQAIPEALAVVGGGTPVVATGGGESGTGGAITGGTTMPTEVSVPGVTVPPAKPVTDKTVDISFTADRTGLFTAWNAIANLADLAGHVQVTIHAESEIGFEKSKLQNGVLEPLREANLID